VAVEKLFSGLFNKEVRSQVIEYSFAAGAEIHRNYCSGSFFNIPLRQVTAKFPSGGFSAQ
jgi:hypothetical protein